MKLAQRMFRTWICHESPCRSATAPCVRLQRPPPSVAGRVNTSSTVTLTSALSGLCSLTSSMAVSPTTPENDDFHCPRMVWGSSPSAAAWPNAQSREVSAKHRVIMVAPFWMGGTGFFMPARLEVDRARRVPQPQARACVSKCWSRGRTGEPGRPRNGCAAAAGSAIRVQAASDGNGQETEAGHQAPRLSSRAGAWRGMFARRHGFLGICAGSMKRDAVGPTPVICTTTGSPLLTTK